MAIRPFHRSDSDESARIVRDRVRSVGAMKPYAGADPKSVEARIRNMTYGSTNNRVSSVRRGELDPALMPAAG